jgi:hypothetical protein
MIALHKFQKEYLLEAFFKHGSHVNWRNIATKLLEDGSCIVPGDKCIWSGGIGNFIKTTTPENAIGCLLYEFDLRDFLHSEFFKEINEVYVSEIQEKYEQIKLQYYGMTALSTVYYESNEAK